MPQQGMLKSYEVVAMNQNVSSLRVRAIYIHLITRIDETAGVYYDPFGGGTLNPTQDPITYAESVSVIYARIMWSDAGTTFLQEVAPGVLMGDCLLGIDSRNQAFITSLIGSEDSYLVVDGRQVLPREIIATRVEGDTGVYVSCQLRNTEDVSQALG